MCVCVCVCVCLCVGGWRGRGGIQLLLVLVQVKVAVLPVFNRLSGLSVLRVRQQGPPPSTHTTPKSPDNCPPLRDA